jgi:hypothetical protein
MWYMVINYSAFSVAMLDNLIAKTFAWEDERSVPFLYDGVSRRADSCLPEIRLTRYVSYNQGMLICM